MLARRVFPWQEDEAVVAVLERVASVVLGNTSGPDALLARFRKYDFVCWLPLTLSCPHGD